MRHPQRLRFNSWTPNTVCERALDRECAVLFLRSDGNIELSPWRAQKNYWYTSHAPAYHTLIACNCMCGWSGSGCILSSVLIALWHEGHRSVCVCVCVCVCVWEREIECMQMIANKTLLLAQSIKHDLTFIIKLTFKRLRGQYIQHRAVAYRHFLTFLVWNILYSLISKMLINTKRNNVRQWHFLLNALT